MQPLATQNRAIRTLAIRVFRERPLVGGRTIRLVALALLYAAIMIACVSHQVAAPAFAIQSLVLGTTLLALSVIDIQTIRLPDALTIPLASVGCVIVAPSTPDAFAWRVASAGVGFLVLYLFARGFSWLKGYPGLGLGDAKLLAASGAWTGMEALPTIVLLACVAALSAVAIAAGVGTRIDLRTRVPFGPFLALATWIVWFEGPLI